MLVSAINQSAGFYLTDKSGFRNEHLVSDKATNPALGIAHVNLSNPTAKAVGAPIFKVSVELDNGIRIFGDVFVNKDGKTMNVRWPQEKYTDANGQVAYADKVSVPLAVTAQVLRYAHTLAVDNGVAAPVAQPVAQPVTAPVAPASAALTGMTQEQLAALVASMAQ